VHGKAIESAEMRGGQRFECLLAFCFLPLVAHGVPCVQSGSTVPADFCREKRSHKVVNSQKIATGLALVR
jgi:hypothetical protein